MSAQPTRARRIVARRTVAQGGFTLMEVLLGLAIATIITVPLLMWMSLGYRQQARVTSQSHDDNATNFVAMYLPRDVLSSSAVATGGVDCGPAAGTSVVVLSATFADTAANRVVYAVEPSADGSTGELHRRLCDVASGAMANDLELSDWVRRPGTPGGWADLVTCAPRPPLTDDVCGEVTLTYRGRLDLPATVSAARRAGPAR